MIYQISSAIKYKLALLLLILLATSSIQAQNVDSVQIKTEVLEPSKKEKKRAKKNNKELQKASLTPSDNELSISEDSTIIPKKTIKKKLVLGRPSRAALMSAVLPGLGQAYNRKYWKIPLVFIGLGFMGYTVNQYHDRYILFRDNLFYSTDNDPNTEVDIRLFFYNDENMRRGKEKWRRDRDYYIILSMLAYGLVVADAAVDGHLIKFDVSDDLSFKIKPSVTELDEHLFAMTNRMGGKMPGLSFVLTLK